MLRIVGDINLTDGYFDTGIGTGSQIKKGLDPFHHIERRNDDFWIGNMECVCASTSEKGGLAAKQFIIAPQDLEHIRHLDLYAIANNHVMQHGAKAYKEMQAYLTTHHTAYVGSNDQRSLAFTHQDKLIGICAFCMRPDNFTSAPLYWHMPELDDIRQELEQLKHCDYRIVYAHWGNEFINYPYIDQKQLAHFLVDCGADLVIGMHPHVLQGYETYKQGTIFYSLGNFVFNMSWEPTKYSVIVNVDLAGRPNLSYDYVRIGSDFCPHPTTDIPKDFQMEHLNSLLNINSENEKYYRQVFLRNKSYQKANRKQVLRNFCHMRVTDSFAIMTDFIRRRF